MEGRQMSCKHCHHDHEEEHESMNTIMTMIMSTITTTDIPMNTATSTAGRAKTGK